MKKVLTSLVLFTALHCVAKDAPAPVTAAFAKMFPGVVVKKWDKEGGSYEANFMKDGKKRRPLSQPQVPGRKQKQPSV